MIRSPDRRPGGMRLIGPAAGAGGLQCEFGQRSGSVRSRAPSASMTPVPGCGPRRRWPTCGIPGSRAPRCGSGRRRACGRTPRRRSAGPRRTGLFGCGSGDFLGRHLQGGCRRTAAALELEQVFRDGPAVVDGPSTLALGTRTSSKNTWFCTSSPEVITSGWISIPGLVMSIRMKVMPCCLRRSGWCAPGRTSSSLRLHALSRSCCRCR